MIIAAVVGFYLRAQPQRRTRSGAPQVAEAGCNPCPRTRPRTSIFRLSYTAWLVSAQQTRAKSALCAGKVYNVVSSNELLEASSLMSFLAGHAFHPIVERCFSWDFHTHMGEHTNTSPPNPRDLGAICWDSAKSPVNRSAQRSQDFRLRIHANRAS